MFQILDGSVLRIAAFIATLTTVYLLIGFLEATKTQILYQSLFEARPILDFSTWHFQIFLSIIEIFNRTAEKNGLMKLVNLRSGGNDAFQIERLNELEAVAQHHGIPTRLIDWSYDSSVAAFFAGFSGGPKHLSSNCCVWCLDTSLVERVQFAKLPPIEIVRTAMNTADRIQAQRGLFTRLGDFHESLDRYFSPNQTVQSWPNLENVIRDPETVINRSDNEPSRPVMRKVVLSRLEVPELLRILHLRGISYSTLFPGLEGVACEVLGHIRPRP
jgi:FRG domain